MGSKMVFFSSTNIKMGLRLGLDMSKTVFFSSTGIRMGYKCVVKWYSLVGFGTN